MPRRLILVLLLPLLLGQSAPHSDEAVWQHFESWVAALPALPPGERVSMAERYVAALRQQGLDEAAAREQFSRVNVIRRVSNHRERVYWDGAFKSGGGPDQPLRLLQEVVRGTKPGRALDAGMGRGRNTIYLSSLGWDATGYDMSADALKVAQSYAEAAGVKITTVEALHDTFPFGEEQWDLIICAYCYLAPDEAGWPDVFWKALKPGGLVVFQSSVRTRRPVDDLAAHWKRFQLLRVEDLDPGMVDDDWGPSLANPTVKLVARKP